MPRSSYYYPLGMESDENLRLMRLMDEQHLRRPHFGSRSMTTWLNQDRGEQVNRKRVQRLMRVMGLEGVFPGKKTTVPNRGHKVYPYLLRGLPIVRANQVWCTDITYIPLRVGFMYLVAIMDWYSRHVLSWRLSNTMDVAFCVEALEEALLHGQPEIFNSDQGSQFTSDAFTSCLLGREIAISMDGRGRALDNVFIERLWRSLKYEDIYLKDYETVADLYQGLTDYFVYYSHERRHQGLGNHTPWEMYTEGLTT